MNKSIFVATASANYLNQGINELQEWDRSLKAARILPDKGIAVLETELSKQEFITGIKERKPVFIRHMHPADYIGEISSTDYHNVVSMVPEYKSAVLPGEKVAVQIRKGAGDYSYEIPEIKAAIEGIIKREFNAQPEVKQPDKIVSLLLDNNKFYMGLSTPKDNLSAWSGGMVHYKKSPDDISRAMYKLMEAIEVFEIDMESFRTALDLGAAPGGWTWVLLSHGLHVTAVDTGDMDKRLMSNTGLRYIKVNAGDLQLEGECFDLLTSDISWNPKNTARMVNRAAGYLAEGGTAVVTLKLMGEKVRKTIKEVLKLYSEVFDVLGVKQLFHNRDEVTLYLKKK